MTQAKTYKRDFELLEARRRRGMQLLAQGASQSAVARELGVSRQTVSCWKRALGESDTPWQNRQLGRPAGLTPADKEKLVQLLEAGCRSNGFERERWTLALVGQVIAREFGLQYSTVHVMRLLRAMGYSLSGKAATTTEMAGADLHRPGCVPHVPLGSCLQSGLGE